MLYIAVLLILIIMVLMLSLALMNAKKSNILMQDEIDKARQEKELTWKFLHQQTEEISKGADKESLYKTIIQITMLISGGMSACVYELQNNSKLKAVATHGLFPPQKNQIKKDDVNEVRAKFIEEILEEEELQKNEGIIGSVVQERKGVLISNADKDPRILQHHDESIKIYSMIAVPLAFSQEVMGALVIVNPIDGKSFTKVDFDLVCSLAEQASMGIYSSKAIKNLIEKNRLDFDLRLASNVQRYLLPNKLPQSQTLEFAVKYIPQQLIGGDFYDCFKLPDGKLAVVMADVSGKGISAAILMALCQTKLKYIAMANQSPADVMKKLNKEIVSSISQNMFITILYAIIDEENSTITYAKSGHEMPVFYSNTNKATIDMPKARGMAIGMIESEIFDTVIEEKTISFEKGDIIVLYTDGATEAVNENDEEFGVGNIKKVVESLNNKTPSEINEAITTSIDNFIGEKNSYKDDLTLLTIKKIS